MRITGGAARSIPLKTGSDSLARPATDRMREAVFSSLGSRVQGARFYDLFAGSGAYGLEAWSRGAAGGIFVERSAAMAAAIRANAAAVGRSLGSPAATLQVVAADVLKWAPPAGQRADLIFVDPPYERIEQIAPRLFLKLRDWLEPSGLLIFEMPGGLDPAPAGWEPSRRLGKGRNQPSCCFYRTAD